MRITVTSPDLTSIRRQAAGFDRATTAAMHKAVDRATDLARKGIQQKMRGVGLGRLANAVKATSSEKKRRRNRDEAWGAIYAAGGDESRAGQTLEAYSRGVTITASKGQWLAIATRALPKRIGRKRTTPALYEAAGSPLGPLVFKQLSANRAILIAQGDFTVSPKTGKAKLYGGRKTRSRVRQRDIIAFVLIRETRRAKRFDQVEVTRRASTFVPKFLAEETASALPGAADKA